MCLQANVIAKSLQFFLLCCPFRALTLAVTCPVSLQGLTAGVWMLPYGLCAGLQDGVNHLKPGGGGVRPRGRSADVLC